jgi:Tfp pilus assembly protein PilX
MRFWTPTEIFFERTPGRLIMDHSESTSGRSERVNERGAALVISLLIATVLLVAGGALIQVTSMSAANAIDSTAETQAYYGAEAGLQAAVNALRGNTTPTASAMPAGMARLTFRNAVLASRSNDCPNGLGGDPTAWARLSRYLPYSNRQTAGTRVTVGTNPTIQYDVRVLLPIGPDETEGTVDDDVMPPAGVEPSRVLVQVNGYGPSGAIKQMSMIVARYAFDPTVPAMMTLIGTPSGIPTMSFESGNSANHAYRGNDNACVLAPCPAPLPAFGTTNLLDFTKATTEAASNTTSTPTAQVLSSSSIPEYLRTPADARDFLTLMQRLAMQGAVASPATATYCEPPSACIGKYAAAANSNSPVGLTFVKGDYTMGSGTGSGTLVVTGELTTNGGTDFSGLLYVIGAGYVNRNGGGGGAFYGANFIARVDWPAQNPALTSFGAPFFQFNGAGNATMQYDSGAVANALDLLVPPVMGVKEH